MVKDIGTSEELSSNMVIDKFQVFQFCKILIRLLIYGRQYSTPAK